MAQLQIERELQLKKAGLEVQERIEAIELQGIETQAALETEKTELAAAVESAKNEVATVKAELASVKKAPAVPSVKSQEFKKNAQPVVASNGSSFSDFMEQIRAKKVN